jgi:hypothetical protein
MPKISTYGKSAGLPNDLSTLPTFATGPFSKSTSTLTVPSIADTLHELTCLSRPSAFSAFIAQSGQSIPARGQLIT